MKHWGYTRTDCKNRFFPNPPDVGPYSGRVTEGDGDGHSIYLRTLINQTQGLSADLHRTDYPEGVRQSSADSGLNGD